MHNPHHERPPCPGRSAPQDECFGSGKPLPGSFVQRLTLDEFHGDEVGPVFASNVVNVTMLGGSRLTRLSLPISRCLCSESARSPGGSTFKATAGGARYR